MSRLVVPRLIRVVYFVCASAALLFGALPAARAGLTMEMDLVRYSYLGNRYYYFFPNLTTNATGPAVPFGTYFVVSPGYPTNGATVMYSCTTNGFNQTAGGTSGFNDFDAPDFNSSFIKSLTNGPWSIFVTNTVTTNVYHFNVTATISSNDLQDVVITFPPYGAVNVTNDPTFSWQGPTNYSDIVVYQQNDNTTLPPSQTNLVSLRVLNQGANSVTVHYDRYPTNLVVCSTPVNSLSQPLSSWVSTCHFQDYFICDFTVGTVDPTGTGHTLVAHYPFDATNGPVLTAAVDTSGNGYNMSFGGGSGAQGGANMTSDSAAGVGAVQFHDGDGSSAGYLGWSNPTPGPLLSALAGSFSVSCWIKTTQSMGGDSDPAYNGAGIVSADNPGLANDVIPLALTGSKIGFNTGGSVEDDTLNSSGMVNDGIYHHVVVTRNQLTGQKIIYLDGMLDSFSSGTTNLLNAPQKLTIGALADASNPDPNVGSYNNGYNGLLDDLQLYSGVLSSNEVAILYSNPGLTAPNVASHDFNAALETTGLVWTTSGDSLWFVQTTNTHDGVSAAQSGSVTNAQTSTLSVTVTGPGTLTFYWSSIANDPHQGFDYEFDIDGGYANDIFGDQSWTQDGPYTIGAGTHTLSWKVSANADSDPTQAGFLDQVNYLTQTIPVITLNPFNQTNYPGYSVALLAAATSNVAVTWEWFKAGSGSPVPNATNAFFIPTNSGNTSVAGSYYAVASNQAGTAITTTATVSFVNTPLPVDWSRAFKSPGFNNNTPTEEYYLAALPDSSGNLYAVGSFTGTNTFGAQTFVSANGVYETELVKQTAAGALLWAVAMTNNGNGNSDPRAVAPAPGDGIYVLGNFSGTNWLGTNKLVDVGGGSVYLARFDASGNILWVRTITSVVSNSDFTGLNCAAADPAGNVTISALISGSTTFTSTNSGTSTNLVASGQLGALARYDANGKLLWAEIPGGWVLNMAGSAGRLYGSMFSPTAGFAGITNVTDRRFSVAAINPTNGQAIWLRGLGAPQNSGNPLGIILDVPLISVYGTNLTVVGIAYGSNAAFGPYTVSWNADAGQYFARYDTNGSPQLANSFGSPTTQPYATLPDASGNIYVGGDFDTFSFFGNDILAAPHEDSIGNGYLSHAFLAKFDRNGNPLWARPALSQYNFVNCRALAAVPHGVWACTTCKSPTSFGTNLVTSSVTCIGSPICTLAYHYSGALGKITESVAALPVTLLNPHDNGANFQFSFQSQSGFTHAVQYRTNLVIGNNWQNYSNVVGDGALKTIPIPYAVFSPSRQGFIRVSTQ
ncbi:MAG TPA: LamG domain-containing protein [Candidatus Binatia bacterium]|jgi:hypothetical protein|nr:LamG domain-containing protein [Candidatus Binatia bacterium]